MPCASCGGPAIRELCARCEAERKAKPEPPRAMEHDSRWEGEYHQWLEVQKRAGAIRDYRWKDFRLRLVAQDGERDRYYSPEALVWAKDGEIEVHEVKGHKREAAMLRFDLARSQWPMFRFRMIEKRGGRWVVIRGDKPNQHECMVRESEAA